MYCPFFKTCIHANDITELEIRAPNEIHHINLHLTSQAYVPLEAASAEMVAAEKQILSLIEVEELNAISVVSDLDCKNFKVSTFPDFTVNYRLFES